MTRSSRERTEESRRRIVAAAGALFRSRGYDAVGIADVMRAAGMTKGGFYKHFQSKAALAAEACSAGFAKAAEMWRREEAGAAPAAALVTTYFSNKPAEMSCPMLAHVDLAGDAEAGDSLRETYSQGAKLLHDTFGAITAGQLDDDRADLMFAAMVGAAMLARATGDAEWTTRLKQVVARAAVPARGGDDR